MKVLLVIALMTPTLSVGAADQVTDNMEKDHWGSRHGTISQGRLLWVRDVDNDPDDIYFFDGADESLIQSDNVNTVELTSAFGLGPGSSPGEVLAAWRRGTDFAWVWTNDGNPPVEIDTKKANPFDPNEFSNAEAMAVDGCAFMVFQAFDDNNDASKHVYRIDPGDGNPIDLTGGGMVNGADRVRAHQCQATWMFHADRDFSNGTLELQFYDGTCQGLPDENSCVRILDSIAVSSLDDPGLVRRDFDIKHGRIVYWKNVGASRQVFLYDTTLATPAAVNLTNDTTRNAYAPRTDGRHVAWLQRNCDGSVDIYLNGGVRLTDETNRPGNPGADFPFVLEQGQMIWKDNAGNLWYLTDNNPRIVDTAPAEAVNNPWLDDGVIAWHGKSDDGGDDEEIFVHNGVPPQAGDDPPPPMRVRARPKNAGAVVEWDRVLGETSYNLYYAEEPGVTKDNYASLAGGTRVVDVSSPFSVTGLVNGMTYYFAISTVESAMEGPSSGETSAEPTVITVDDTTDTNDTNPGDGVCADEQGNCTLRAAVQEASHLDAGATIVVPAGTYTLSLAGSGEDLGATGDLDITGGLILEGDGRDVTIIDGDGLDRLFDVDPSMSGLEVEIRGVTLRNGMIAQQSGAGLRNRGSTVLAESSVIDNTAGGFTSAGGIDNSGEMIVQDVVVHSNDAGDQAGGISNSGCITLVDSQVSWNSANTHGGNLRNFSSRTMTLIRTVVTQGLAGVGGGGIYSSGRLSLFESEVFENSSVFMQNWAGGGIYNENGTLIVTGSTIHGNASPIEGGGIHNEGGTVTLVNSTVSGNSAATHGGGIHNISYNANRPATLTLHNVTLGDNSAVAGGAIYNENDYNMVSLRHTILADSVDSGNCDGYVLAIVSEGHNLDSGDTCNLDQGTDHVDTDPLLGDLGNNGGPTPTHALMTGSPAIDAGDAAGCTNARGALLELDQRGGERHHDGNGDAVAICDLGAYEELGACEDTDTDGFGLVRNPVCVGGSSVDCDDSDPAVYPGAAQICDGRNNDCTHGSWPGLAGTNEADNDGDGFAQCEGDCEDGNPDLWGSPAEVPNLVISADGETLYWNDPVDSGGTAVPVAFDVLRSQDPADFVDAAFCVESDDAMDNQATDVEIPLPERLFSYLVRAGNTCGNGTLGSDSNDFERPGAVCP